MKKILISIFALLSFLLVVDKVYAKEETILFWGVNCPYCHVVRDKLDNEGLREKVKIQEIEIQQEVKNQDAFMEKVQLCGIDEEQAGVPMLFSEGKCYSGVDSIMAKVRNMASANSGGEVVEEPTPIEKKEKSKGQINTEKLILIVLGFLIVLPIFGYFVKKRRGKEVGILASLLLLPFFFTTPVNAVCPLCTVAVGAGVGLSRSLGIDDSIVGVWIGGFLISSSLWLAGWIQKKKFAKKVSSWVWSLASIVLMYAFVLIPMKITGLIGIPNNTLFGIDKVLLGVVLGSIMFFLGSKLHTFLKEKNKGKVFFPYQKVVIPVASLLIATIILYFIVY